MMTHTENRKPQHAVGDVPTHIEKRIKIAMSDAISEASEKFSDYGKRFSNTDNPMKTLYWNYLSQGERGYSTAFERMFMKELVVGQNKGSGDHIYKSLKIASAINTGDNDDVSVSPSHSILSLIPLMDTWYKLEAQKKITKG